MMLRWSFGRPDAAALIERAVRGALRDGWRTPDLMPATESASEREASRAERSDAGHQGGRDGRLRRRRDRPPGPADDRGSRLVSDAILLYDTTLRDGTQREGMVLSLADKVRIARRLDEAGFPYVEGGWPGSNPKDVEFFEAARGMTWQNARIAAFGSTRHRANRPDQDPNLAALVEARTPVITIFGKSWLLHVTEVLGATADENLAMVEDSVAFCRQGGKVEVVYDAEHFFDGYKADRDYALATLRAAHAAGAGTLVLCDTNGGCMTDEISGHRRRRHRHARPWRRGPLRHPRPRRCRPGRGQLAGRRARRRAPRPGHGQRLRRALRQRQHRDHLGRPGAQDGPRDGARRAPT